MMISYRDCEKAFTKFTYDKGNNVFIIGESERDSIEYYPALSLDSEYKPENYGWQRY